MVSGEATNANFVVFGFTRSALEPTIYRTRSEHANNCSTDAVNVYTLIITPQMHMNVYGFTVTQEKLEDTIGTPYNHRVLF